MALIEEFEKTGRWLFRWRSFLPFLILPFLLLALKDSEYFQQIAESLPEKIWESFSLTISFLGLFIRCIVVGYAPKRTSGRNTKKQKAKTLNTTGMYSLLRHPLYLGNFIIFLGILLFIAVWWFALISVMAFWLYYERIMFAEEDFLRKKFGNAFTEWAVKTSPFFPRFRNWQKPLLSFSLKNVLKREYTGFFLIISSFTFLDMAGDFIPEGKLGIDSGWLLFFIFGLIIYITLRTLKKKTNILDVKER